MNSEVGFLEDPDKGRPVQLRKKCIILMQRRENDDSEIVLKHNSLIKWQCVIAYSYKYGNDVQYCIFIILGELNA